MQVKSDKGKVAQVLVDVRQGPDDAAGGEAADDAAAARDACAAGPAASAPTEAPTRMSWMMEPPPGLAS